MKIIQFQWSIVCEFFHHFASTLYLPHKLVESHILLYVVSTLSFEHLNICLDVSAYLGIFICYLNIFTCKQCFTIRKKKDLTLHTCNYCFPKIRIFPSKHTKFPLQQLEKIYIHIVL